MGIKRKLEDPEVTTTVVQRQSILDISMFKLQSNPVKRVEPSPQKLNFDSCPVCIVSYRRQDIHVLVFHQQW